MSDFSRKLEEARHRLPLERMMTERGRDPKGRKCPYCGKTGHGLFKGKTLWKCHHTSCASGTAAEGGAWDQVGFLAHELKLNRKDAAIVLLKEAGVWEEQERLAPSVMPGKRGRKRPLPREESEGPKSEVRSPESEGGSATGQPAPAPPEAEEVFENLPPPPATGSEFVAEPSIEQPIESVVLGRISRLDGEVAVPGEPQAAVLVNASAAGSPTPPADAANFPARGAGSAGVEGAEAASPDAPPPAVSNGEGRTQKEEPLKETKPLEPPEGGTPNGPKPAEDPDGEAPEPLRALRWFYRRLHLTDADREALWVKRGLTGTTVAALGYRSNLESNRALLEEMGRHFRVEVLLDCGLWQEGDKPGEKPQPNRQYYGMSIREKRDERGKKVRDEDGRPVKECVWDEPILIPYFDEAGELIHLRPHKGMMKDKPVRLYVCRPSKEYRAGADGSARCPNPEAPRFAVISEGEFKSAALWQVLGPACATASVPGINTAKPLQGDLEEWLESLADGQLRQVVVGYDSEEKGDPALPGYTPEEWKRFDSQIWARWLARALAKEGYDAKVCLLPKEWRDEKGKADWDGCLARQLDGLYSEKRFEKLEGEAFWLAAQPKVKADWLALLKQSKPVHELWQTGFFDSKEERIIKNGLERISYVAKLPVGDDEEEKIARRLQRLVNKLKGAANVDRMPAAQRGFLITLAKKYIDLKGGYYVMKPLQEKSQDRWNKLLAQASDDGDVEVKRACEIALKGIPERVSDFHMKPHYVLKRLNGTRERLVTLHSIHGVNTPLLALPSAPFAQPSKFREWLLNNITAGMWRAGERELNDLQADVGREVAFKDVSEVATRGYHHLSKCWFFKDVTYGPDGKEIFGSQKHDILWIPHKAAEGEENVWQAYKLGETDHEGQTFKHGEPRMRPKTTATAVVDRWLGRTNGSSGKLTEVEATRMLFQQVSQKLFETIGGYEGYLALGTILSLGAGPEIFEAFTGFPGLWIHGEPRQGKTSVARWLMRIWGLSVPGGIVLKDSTKVGMGIALQQYGNLPVWFEEYQADAPSWMIEKLKNVFDRASGAKKTFDEGDRQILAGCIVTGVATSSDSQLRSRFVHVQVAERNRLILGDGRRANHFDWFQGHCEDFYLLGRFVLRNRKEFARLVVERIQDWLKLENMQGIDPRARIVHGAAYGAFYALVALLESHAAEDLRGYREFLLGHCRTAVREVQESVNVDQFWRDLLDALSSDAFGETLAERQRIFKVVPNPLPNANLTETQLQMGVDDDHYAWQSYLLFFKPGAVIDLLRRYKRSQGRELPLDKNDLRAQMRTRGYWVEPKGDCHRQKFGCGSRTPESCWCIDLDGHELGLRRVSDEEFLESLRRRDPGPAQGQFLGADWIDPRRGDLFALVDAVTPRRQKEGEEE